MAKKNILFVVSECAPFIKTGGLADVAGSLPRYFNRRKYDVRVMMPKYTCLPEKYKSKMTHLTHFYTGFRFREQYVGIDELVSDSVHYYFLDSEFYFSGSWPYQDVYDDIEKFAFFSRIVLSSLPLLNWKPDILHCHDWQSALVPVYLNDYFQGDLFFHKMKTVMTIHNLKFQGVYDIDTVRQKTGLSEYYFTDDKMKVYQNGNLLKGGLVYADRITTVSETYANEIKTEYYGEGLDGLIRAKENRLTGIVNGIDYDFYNPEKDRFLAFPYSEENAITEKKKNKAALQKELGLSDDPDKLMIAVVSRLTDQKGIDLIRCVFDELVENAQFVLLGTGDSDTERFFREKALAHPESVSANLYYSEEMSHKIYASSDAFLMPSRFEPCGLSQLMALRYGSLPIVRETGGLKDTVIPYNEYEETGTGFSFANYNAHEMLATVNYAKEIFYRKKKSWNRMMISAMQADFSWQKSVRSYEQLYDDLIQEKRTEEKGYQKKK